MQRGRPRAAAFCVEALSPADRTLQSPGRRVCDVPSWVCPELGVWRAVAMAGIQASLQHVVDDFFERRGKRRDSLGKHDRRSSAQPKPNMENPTLVRPGLGLPLLTDIHGASRPEPFRSLTRSIVRVQILRRHAAVDYGCPG